MIIFLQALYNQNAYIYKYACTRHPKGFKSSPHTPTAISISQSRINTFLPEISSNDRKITISVNSKQNVPMSVVSH